MHATIVKQPTHFGCPRGLVQFSRYKNGQDLLEITYCVTQIYPINALQFFCSIIVFFGFFNAFVYMYMNYNMNPVFALNLKVLG